MTDTFQPENNNATVDLSSLLPDVQKHNPDIMNMKLPQVFELVVERLAAKNLFVLMSNHVSKASWCCSIDDGNGWFGDEHFNIDEWFKSLTSMATLMKSHENVVAMDLRNELRCVLCDPLIIH